ncbi:hypothetical protein Hdeb2414_s0001g00022521 [Helianthus debilis subsp. tardiflorus]
MFCCFFYVGGRTNVYRGLPGGAFHLLGYMTDTQTIVDDDCIPMKYDESPAKIRMNPVKFRPSSGEQNST